MAKSKRPQQPKRIGQSQPEGVSRERAAKNGASVKSASASVATATRADTSKSSASKPSVGAADSGASKLNAIRERTAASARASDVAAKPGASSASRVDRLASGLTKRPQQKRYARPPWWRRNLGPLITVSAVVLLIGSFIAFALYQNHQAAAGIGDSVPSSIMKTLTTIPASDFQTVGNGSGAVTGKIQATAANTPLLTANGKPEVIYVGAEYCPYCAAERWGTVIALSRFGTFSGLVLMRSSGTDANPNTPTLSFRNASYSSQYIVFNTTETTDRTGNPLATPPADVMTFFTQYDSAGSIPFMSYGNQYVTIGAPFIPTMMQGLSWQQVADQLKDPTSAVSQAVIGSANYQTAAICKITNNQPGKVCNTPIIQQLEAGLPAAQ
jgi:hypothetical protein